MLASFFQELICIFARVTLSIISEKKINIRGTSYRDKIYYDEIVNRTCVLPKLSNYIERVKINPLIMKTTPTNYKSIRVLLLINVSRITQN